MSFIEIPERSTFVAATLIPWDETENVEIVLALSLVVKKH